MHTKRTILLIDDEDEIKESLKDVLISNYNVIDVSNGKEALEILEIRSGEIAVIVLDLLMPVMDGFEFMKNFKKHKEYDTIPVIVATSNDDEYSEQTCLEAGVWDFVMKPYNPVMLQFRIRNVIEKSRMLMAERDPVTNIYSKPRLYQEIRRMLSEYTEETFAFVKIDIDRFKMINNYYGQKEGDKILCSIANELLQMSKIFDKFVYGRIENDIFGVCMSHRNDDIELLIKAMQINLNKINKDYNIKVSFGVYVIEDRNMDITDMYDRAHLASQTCKGKFMKTIAYYDESMLENMRKEQFVINEVNRALEEEQFEVYFQPKINLVTDRSYGAEALVRWKHPERGMISPGEFIPVYEKNGIIGKLDQYMWRQVCKVLRKWIDAGIKPNPISVNVSRVNIYNPRLVEILKKLITEFQIPAYLLNLELTESAFMEEQDLIMKTMSRLHKLGFKIMMDDFGSGYSSLNVLKDMEVDYLKVDMKFLQQDKEFNGKGEKVLTSVIRMAKWLHMPAIVEGVETVEQVDFLKCIGCEYAQGYYFAKPMPLEEYETFLEKEKNTEHIDYYDENFDFVGELWNTRSKLSLFFDMLDVPIAIYEYRNNKLELLRTNKKYDNEISMEDNAGELKNEERRIEEREMFLKAFEKIASGDYCEPIEYEVTEAVWYYITIKMIGKRADTTIMMVTFNDISIYK